MLAAVDLHALLATHAERLDFYQVLRLVENAHADLPRIGTSLRPRDDAVRLGQEAGLAFAPGALAAYDTGHGGRPPRLRVHFFGLLGPNGPLPLHLTEFARDRARNSGDPTLVRFLDVFHHRMLTFFYRAWAAAQPVVNRDRPHDDRFALYVGALCGLGLPALRARDAVPDRAKLHFAGVLSPGPRHADGLRAILQTFFRVPVTNLQFVGQWLEVPADLRTRLGARVHAQLGQSTTLGGRSWQAQHKFRVRIGPVGRADFERFLPGGASLPRLVAWIRNYVGDTLDWDLQLVLRPEAVPECRIGAARAGATRLGWTTWLGGAPAKRRCDRLVLDARTVELS
ncbi:MAG TPA: type VI secretion system baseplate subunit TssG [Burkholderiaceae bacterium]|nr:type VI secretion system baseplate subunit TssG [Burkholderiaceae bacterium]